MDEYAGLRHKMVREQIAGRGLTEPRLLAAFDAVPRERFMPKKLRHMAYSDRPLPIGFRQTISQPYIVALMTNILHLQGGERVLDVGTGSGYQAAILAHMCGEVHTIEFLPQLAASAEKLLKELGLANVYCHLGDGSLGWPPAAPYAGILVSAAAPRAPAPVLEQLVEGGRLVLPVGPARHQTLEAWQRHGDQFEERAVTNVAFVPLLGEHGWPGTDDVL
jgi:protein-L-isoaspartate(D-aspartate) O-methyltransferase